MLTKPRDPAKIRSASLINARKRRRFSPLMLIGVSIPVLLALIAGTVFVLPHVGSRAADPNMNCTLMVPPNPLTAQGLATPYQLVATDPAMGPCNEANAAQGAFVQADIIDPATGQISTYSPLVVDQGTQPAIAPTPPTLPANAVVGIWFGFNGTTLTVLKNNAANMANQGNQANGNQGNQANQGAMNGNQANQGAMNGNQANQANQGAMNGNQANGNQGATAAPAAKTPRGKMQLGGNMASGNCVNGVANSPFGQFAYCNAPAFFQAANAAIQAGKLTVPAIGTANDGQPCPTVRDFALVDMDQSDNVQTQYLANANGQIAQNTAANKAQLQNATLLGNPSDNALLTNFVAPALGCQSWTVPDLADNNNMVATYATDELQAAAMQQQPVALVPAGDPMVLNNNNPDLNKLNAYRAGANQTPAATLNDASTTTYCQNLVNIQPARLKLDMANFQQKPSPDGGATANNLFTFLANRLSAALGADGLNCVGLLNIQNPIQLTTDGNGVVTAATINPVTPANGNNGNNQNNGNMQNGNNGANQNGNNGTMQNGNNGNMQNGNQNGNNGNMQNGNNGANQNGNQNGNNGANQNGNNGNTGTTPAPTATPVNNGGAQNGNNGTTTGQNANNGTITAPAPVATVVVPDSGNIQP